LAALVAEVTADPGLTIDEQFNVASLAAHLPLFTEVFPSESIRLGTIEATDRALIAQFPSSPQSYRELLILAKDCGDAQASEIAGYLAKVGISDDVKLGAAQILEREALLGKPLSSVLSQSTNPSVQPPASAGGITILYVWTLANPACVYTAQEIQTLAQPGASIIGLCLDSNLAGAQAFAAAQSLPGFLIYDAAGPNSAIAKALFLDGDCIVVVANKAGLIVSTCGKTNMSSVLAAANQ
jgi:hypothetical protein